MPSVCRNPWTILGPSYQQADALPSTPTLAAAYLAIGPSLAARSLTICVARAGYRRLLPHLPAVPLSRGRRLRKTRSCGYSAAEYKGNRQTGPSQSEMPLHKPKTSCGKQVEDFFPAKLHPRHPHRMTHSLKATLFRFL
jgi:hypothetical protein